MVQSYPPQGSDQAPWGSQEPWAQQYQNPQQGGPQYGNPQYGNPQYGNPQYGNPQYGGSMPYYGALAQPTYNAMAVIALISVFLAPVLVPVILGHLAHAQIRRTGERGSGIATAALVIGYLELAIIVIVLVTVLSMFATVV